MVSFSLSSDSSHFSNHHFPLKPLIYLIFDTSPIAHHHITLFQPTSLTPTSHWHHNHYTHLPSRCQWPHLDHHCDQYFKVPFSTSTTPATAKTTLLTIITTFHSHPMTPHPFMGECWNMIGSGSSWSECSDTRNDKASLVCLILVLFADTPLYLIYAYYGYLVFVSPTLPLFSFTIFIYCIYDVLLSVVTLVPDWE
jgi:hypothetical protein